MSAPDDHGMMVSVALFPHLCSTEAEIRLTTKPFLQRWKRKDFAEKTYLHRSTKIPRHFLSQYHEIDTTISLFVDINVSVMNISHPTRFMCILCVGDWLADLTGKIQYSHRTILCPWRSVSFMIRWKH